jgi:hypothetical protein
MPPYTRWVSLVQIEGYRQRIGTNRGGAANDSTKAQDGQDGVFLKFRPIQRVIRVVRGLWRKDNVGVFASTVLEEARVLATFRLVLVKEVDGAGHMAFSLGFQHCKAHGDDESSGRYD